MPVSAGSETSTDSQPFPRAPDWDGDARRLFWMAFRWCLWYMRRPPGVVLGLYALGLLLALVSKGDLDLVGGLAGLFVVPLAFSFSGAASGLAFEPRAPGERQTRALSVFMSLRPISRRRTWGAVTFGPLLATLLVYLVCMTLPYGMYVVVWPDVSYWQWAIGDEWWWSLFADAAGDGAALGAERTTRIWLVLLPVSVLAWDLLFNWLSQFDWALTLARLREMSVLLLSVPSVALVVWSLWWLTTGIANALDITDALRYGPWTFIPPAMAMIAITLCASRAAYASAPLLEERKRAWGALWAMAKAWAVCAGVLVLIYGIAFVLRHTGQVG